MCAARSRVASASANEPRRLSKRRRTSETLARNAARSGVRAAAGRRSRRLEAGIPAPRRSDAVRTRRAAIEARSRRGYEATIRFYQQAGYEQISKIKDFYRIEDDKLVFSKQLTP